jgi:hypothetical protein
MVTMNSDPEAGGNTDQPDDGRDEQGRLPEPLDAAHYGQENPSVEVIQPPGMPASQPAGTGPVISSPLDDDEADEVGVMHRDDSAAAQGGPDVEHDISGTPVHDGPAAPSAPGGLHSGNTPSRTSGVMAAEPAKKTSPKKASPATDGKSAEAKATDVKTAEQK